ncbi:hypothetical protein B0J11DRAFT_108087 [Dendryphion nanum]|uniref:Sad1 interacting factor 1 n=1 Tax=Dendryphion nanum TaxID=256645 RepID=A0A9P9DDP8_9PLEO|nr:hypothetical protein B0J11DRAFT_108087 [Dendryphion nanum]
MADSSPASATGGSPLESPAQEKARLRRERRAAKIQSGGASRLQAISSLQGGSHRDVSNDIPEVKPSPTASPYAAPPTSMGTATPDPEEIDISQHHYMPASQPRLPSPFAFDSSSPATFPGQGAGMGQHVDPSQDPMFGLLQQMMQGQGQSGQPGQAGELPPGLANMFQAMQGGAPPEPSPSQSSAWVWRLMHAVFSLALAVYIVFQTPFTGSKAARKSIPVAEDDWAQDSTPAETFRHFFYLFSTLEVVLQSSRYFIEKGQLQGTGVLNTIGQILPEPYAGYVRVVGRYSVIYSTVVSDAMVVVFVLGATSWWKGAVAS